MIPLHDRKRTALKEAVLQSVDPNLEQTLALIKPNAMSPFLVEQIMEIIRKHRFEVLIKKKIWLTKDQVMKFYAEHEGRPFFNNLVEFLSAAPIFALVLAREDAVKTWREVMGPTNPNRAKEDAPRSIRALCGVDNLINSVYGSDSVEAAKRDIALLFESDMAQSIMDIPYVEPEGASSVSQKTFAILKPDVAGYSEKVEAIIQKIIWSGMTVYKREEFQMTREQASELYALHKNKEFFEEAASFLSR
jgi:nucleoside diphosphate kinase